jgi:hypothetical protein
VPRTSYRLRFYRDAESAPEMLRQNVARFLEEYMPEGSVVTSPTVFHTGCSWTVAVGEDEQVLGLAAQRVISNPDFTAVVVRGTYLHPRLRGSALAPLLLHGHLAWLTWLSAPRKRVYWCTRTRNPAVYAASARHNDIYPKLDDPEANRAASTLAASLVRAAYGPHATLDPATFVLRGSFAAGAVFLPATFRREHPGPIRRYFMQHLDYERDDNLFIMSEVRPRLMILFAQAYLLHKVVGGGPWRAWLRRLGLDVGRG